MELDYKYHKCYFKISIYLVNIVGMNEKDLIDLGLPSYELGYYQINDEVSIDVEGTIRIDCDYTTRPLYMMQVYNIDELKKAIEFINRI